MNYPHIAARLFSRPQMIHEGKLQAIMQWLSPRMGVDAPQIAAELVEHRAESGNRSDVNTIAVIEVGGTLVNRGASADGYSGITSYEWLGNAVSAAVDEPKVQAVLLKFDSYGGEVSGAFDCADVIAKAGNKKPVWAMVDDNCYSAAYLLASQCDRIIATRTGGCGSIGVIAVHVDQSGYDAKMGVKFTSVYAGARKNDFSLHQPLAEEPLAWLHAEVERDYDLFCEYVGRGRGRRLTKDAAKKTEAALFTGEDAVAAGLADAVMTRESALAAIAEQINKIGGTAASNPANGGSMSTVATAAESPKQTAGSPENCTSPDCPMKGGKKEDKNMQSERARIAAILNSPEAKGREQLARHIAFETEMDADQASKLLAAAPKESAAPVNPLAAEMAKVANPNVGLTAGEVDSEGAAIAMILGKEVK